MQKMWFPHSKSDIMRVRTPKVAGAFYPGTENEINSLVRKIIDTETEDESNTKKGCGCNLIQ